MEYQTWPFSLSLNHGIRTSLMSEQELNASLIIDILIKLVPSLIGKPIHFKVLIVQILIHAYDQGMLPIVDCWLSF